MNPMHNSANPWKPPGYPKEWLANPQNNPRRWVRLKLLALPTSDTDP